MRIFTGKYERSIDAKNRLQLPSQLRAAVEPERDGKGLFVTLGEYRGTLSIFTQCGFEELAARIETEFMPGPESRRFELQFYGLASYVEMDKQGRIVLPDRLRKKAVLGEEVFLVGQKYRIDIWNRPDLERSMAIDWEGIDMIDPLVSECGFGPRLDPDISVGVYLEYFLPVAVLAVAVERGQRVGADFDSTARGARIAPRDIGFGVALPFDAVIGLYFDRPAAALADHTLRIGGSGEGQGDGEYGGPRRHEPSFARGSIVSFALPVNSMRAPLS